MLALSENVKIYIYKQSCDMRKSINGLSSLVFDEFESSPQSGDLFLFCNKARDRLKLLFWHKNGFIILYKRIEKCKFKLSDESAHFTINQKQLTWLLAGLDFNLMTEFSELDYSDYY